MENRRQRDEDGVSRRDVLRGGALAAGVVASGAAFLGADPAEAATPAPAGGPFGAPIAGVAGAPAALTPGLSYCTIAAQEFIPVNFSTGRAMSFYGAWTDLGPGTLLGFAHLPNGAVLTELTVWAYNTSGADAAVALLAAPNGDPFGATTVATATVPSGAAAIQTVTAPSFSHVVSPDRAYSGVVSTPTNSSVRISSMRLGYQAPDAGLRLVTPTRIYDSRPTDPPLGGIKGPLANGATRVLDAKNNGSGVPAGARAVLVNLTVVNTSASGFLTLFKTGTTLPAVSSINWFTTSEIVANTTVSQVDATGQLSAYVPPSSSTDFFVDVLGYYP